MQKPTEPDKTRPCWVLCYDGSAKGGDALRVRLREYVWTGFTWRRTSTPDEKPTSLYKALERADWWGRLPGQGRKKLSLTVPNLDRARPLFEAGWTYRKVAKELGIGLGTVQKLHKLWARTA